MDLDALERRREAAALRLEGGGPGRIVVDDLDRHVPTPGRRKILERSAATVS